MNATTETTAAAFFYVDGIPTKGTWVELDTGTTWETIAEALREKFPGSDCDEILCADAEGLARHFLSRHDCFDLTGWIEWIEAAQRSSYDPEVIALYCDNIGDWSEEAVEAAEDNYWGEHDSPADFAAELLEGSGELASIPESLRYYFDYASYARDLLSGDFFECEGHYFRSV